MEMELLAVALEREHIEIDDALTAFAAGPVTKERDLEPLSGAIGALRRHIYLEEEFLFPPLRETGLMARSSSTPRRWADMEHARLARTRPCRRLHGHGACWPGAMR